MLQLERAFAVMDQCELSDLERQGRYTVFPPLQLILAILAIFPDIGLSKKYRQPPLAVLFPPHLHPTVHLFTVLTNNEHHKILNKMT